MFHPQSTRQHILRQFGSPKQQLRVINDRVLAQARPALRTQISLLLEKQSGFPDTEEFKIKRKGVWVFGRPKILGTEVCVMFSAVPGLTMAVLSWLSARTLWAHFDQDVMSPFLFFKLTLLQQLNICSGCWRRWSRQLQTLNCPRTNAPKLCCFYLKGFLSIFYLYCLLLFAVLCHSVYFLWTLHVEQSQSIHMLDKHRSITYFSEQQN